ncbi:MAG: PAS domain-containing protein [Halorubrum sp.]
MTMRPCDGASSRTTPPPSDSDRFLATVAVDGEVVFAGPSVPAVLGVDRESFTGDDFLGYVHSSARDSVSDALSAVATDRRVTHRMRHASGGYVWVESVVDDELAPRLDGRVVTTRRVDTDGAFPDRFREFLEYGTDIVTVVDDEGCVRYESPSVEDVLGYEQGSLVGQSPLGYVHPGDREQMTERFYRALSEPDAAPSFEYRYRTAEGDWVWLESRVRSLPDDAAVGHLVINSRDVSDRKQRERRLADRNDRLDRFASIVSHDLRSPLSVVQASMEMAQHTGDLEPLARGERAADRIDRLATELLTLARQGDGIDDPTEFSLAAIAHDAWDVAGTPEGDLVVGADATIHGDPGRLRQAFENLFRNSAEHGWDDDRRGAGDDAVDDEWTPTVVVSATDDGFVVADDGTGIDPEHRTAVFDFGFTTSDAGTGYGLDIVQEVVESHGWTIRVVDPEPEAIPALAESVEKSPPDGACFVVRAPAPTETDTDEPWIER